MLLLAIIFSVFLSSAALPSLSPVGRNAESSTPNPALYEYAEFRGKVFVNKGLVAFGLIASNFTESTGDTLGGIGSAIALKIKTYRERAYGDVAYNILRLSGVIPRDGTANYQGRQHEIDFVLQPYYGDANLSFSEAQETLTLRYKRTRLYWDRFNKKTSGLDALAVRHARSGFPEVPIPSKTFNPLTVDCEGLVLDSDGSFWMSDEYGPYIYKFSSSSHLLHAIQPPKAILPFINGTLNFTSDTNPDTGRAGNQGLEGLTTSPGGRTLYGLLQSATMQDGGTSKTTKRYTRLLAYDLSNTFAATLPLVGEWVVPLSQTKKGKTLAQSEVHFVSHDVFLVLSRDGDGHDDNDSSYKQADLMDISGATDIHDTEFDDPTHPIAVDGVLNSSITPALYVSFVDFLAPEHLSRFGLHNINGDPADATLINAKWESLALAPCEDVTFPDDYFLFTVRGALTDNIIINHSTAVGTWTVSSWSSG